MVYIEVVMIQLKVKINSSMDYKLREAFHAVDWETLLIGRYGIIHVEFKTDGYTNIVFKSDESKTFFLIKYSS
jgi:hypothetical protein